jgi:PLP dependent protein
MDFAAVRENLARAREVIAQVQVAEGLTQPVRIVAVTKGHPVAAVEAAVHAGLGDIGESRVQEAVGKRTHVGDVPVRWHLIGHLQTNKARFVPGLFDVVQSVDSAKVLTALDGAMQRERQHGKDPLHILLQVNVAQEDQKSGCSVEEASALAHDAAALSTVVLDGLMTMAPFTDDERVQREVFGSLRRLQGRLQGEGLHLPELSMGMSGDYRAAVAEGATMVRLGTVLFGERQERDP